MSAETNVEICKIGVPKEVEICKIEVPKEIECLVDKSKADDFCAFEELKKLMSRPMLRTDVQGDELDAHNMQDLLKKIQIQSKRMRLYLVQIKILVLGVMLNENIPKNRLMAADNANFVVWALFVFFAIIDVIYILSYAVRGGSPTSDFFMCLALTGASLLAGFCTLYAKASYSEQRDKLSTFLYCELNQKINQQKVKATCLAQKYQIANTLQNKLKMDKRESDAISRTLAAIFLLPKELASTLDQLENRENTLCKELNAGKIPLKDMSSSMFCLLSSKSNKISDTKDWVITAIFMIEHPNEFELNTDGQEKLKTLLTQLKSNSETDTETQELISEFLKNDSKGGLDIEGWEGDKDSNSYSFTGNNLNGNSNVTNNNNTDLGNSITVVPQGI